MATREISFKTRVLKGFLWLGTGSFAAQAISWFSTIFVIRLLRPSDFGLMAMTVAYTELLTSISLLGMNSSLIQAKKVDEGDMRRIFGFLILTGLAGFVVSWFAAPAVAAFFAEKQLVTLVRFLSLNFIIYPFHIIPESLLVREINFKERAKVQVAVQLAGSALTLFLAIEGMGVWALAIGAIAGGCFRVVGFNLASPGKMRPDFRFWNSPVFLKYGAGVTGARLIRYLYGKSDSVIIAKFLGKSLLGIYGIALNLATMPVEKVLPLITQLTFTSYSRIQEDRERIARNLLRTTRIIAMASFPLFFGMSVLAPAGIPFVLGAKWRAAVVPFQLLCLTVPLKALAPVLSPAVYAIGKPGRSLRANIVMNVIMVPAFLLGVRHGIYGICIAWTVVFPIAFAVTSMMYLKALDIPLADYFREIRFPLFSSAAMLAIMRLAGRIDAGSHTLFNLAMTGAAGIFFYAAVVIAFKKEECQELKKMLDWRTAPKGG